MEIEIIKSKRKSVAIEIKTNLRIIVRAPLYMSNRAIESFIEEKKDWILKSIKTVKERNEKHKQKEKLPCFSSLEIKELTQKAKQIIPQRTEYFANIIDVKYNRISIRHQSTRWGSCSSKKNLNFNCLLVLCPQEITDYVIVHELCHLRHPNHSKAFWNEVFKFCPEYKKHREWLKKQGFELIERINNK